MPYCIRGVRIGTRIYVPGSDFVLNGTIERPEHIEYLKKDMGYRLKWCAGIPERRPTEEELAEMEAADKLLGIHRRESGTTALEGDIKKGLRDILAPLRKAFHLNPFARRS